MGFKDGYDQWGRPQYINTQTVAEYFRNDILATDRLYLRELNKLNPLFPFQRIFLKECFDKQFLWFQAMRGGGKTTGLARFAVDYALMVPDTTVVLTAPTFRQALLTFDECLRIIEREGRNANTPVQVNIELKGDPRRNSLESSITLYNGSRIIALPMGDGRRIRGYRGGVLIVDEFYQITQEMYESHIMPFVGVKQGGKESKIIHATTSWSQDCFAYERLMQIASEVRAGNPAYGILDVNLKDLVDCGFPLSEGVWKDARKHQNRQTFLMTYFNFWPESQARWFDQPRIDAACSASHGIRVEMAPSDGVYFAVIDLAASEKGDSTFATVWKWSDGSAKPVWATKQKGLDSTQRAWLAHEIENTWNPQFLIYDFHGAIGKDFRSELAKKELLVNGTLHKVTPLVHHDDYNLDGKMKLIPVDVKDRAVITALVGPPENGCSIRGEYGLRDLLMTKTRELLTNGNILGPYTASEEADLYDGSEIKVLDNLREAFSQLGLIGLKKDKTGSIMRTQDGTLLFETRPGHNDDGAMNIIYGSIGVLRLLNAYNRRDYAYGGNRAMVYTDEQALIEKELAQTSTENRIVPKFV